MVHTPTIQTIVYKCGHYESLEWAKLYSDDPVYVLQYSLIAEKCYCYNCILKEYNRGLVPDEPFVLLPIPTGTSKQRAYSHALRNKRAIDYYIKGKFKEFKSISDRVDGGKSPWSGRYWLYNKDLSGDCFYKKTNSLFMNH